MSFVLFTFICKHQQQSRVPDKINIVNNENGHMLVYLQLFLTVLKWGNFCNFSFDMMNVLRSFFYVSYSKTLTILLYPVTFPADFVPKKWLHELNFSSINLIRASIKHFYINNNCIFSRNWFLLSSVIISISLDRNHCHNNNDIIIIPKRTCYDEKILPL